MKERTIGYLDNFFKLHPEMYYLRDNVVKSVELMVNLKPQNKILICGNGGSAADSEHISGEFLKSFMLKRKVKPEFAQKLSDMFEDGKYIADNLQQGIKAIPLTSFVAFNSAYLNDCEPRMTFAQLVNALGLEGDILVAISTSGNSKNVLFAAEVAKAMGIKVISLTGQTGGKLKELSDVLINVPENLVWRIQEMHLPIYHLICLCVESELFEE